MTRYLITGAAGMLGTDLVAALDGREVTALTRADLDVTDSAAVAVAVAGHDVILNASAYTRVDDAETDEPAATLVNATGAGVLATAAAAIGATLVQYSTDYVFDGTASEPYAEDHPLAPVSAYGRGKAEGERLVREANGARSHVIRTAWLYGAGGGNFAKTILRLATERETLSVVADQVGQPTFTRDLAEQTVRLLDSGVPNGTWHGTNAGQASWFDFARAIFERAGLDPERVTPTDSSQFTRPAPRPAYSVLGHNAWTAAGLTPMRDWRSALDAAFASGALGAP
ncbi:dTDP-4-dehydrorhamnose reductase [Glaciihabitans arcticus]|uniref:dTDP-4-dehydrorhamnose reductase n=1 Tax=Glaciihabitans arcticus TaxID=2668039 RepID=A0A4Q9GQT0_9MICO|nr:dTDP-4-dehydrorhamnose reductase [Glaciihabitans arcticus]TBN55938.1 dTDP-4-dehydrorhamnose reductase [Glaciihabitans arcticus]